jgi:magnesium transporter
LRDIGAAEAVAVLEEMDRDDVADLLRALPEEYSEELLRRMRKEESLEVEGLLGYAEDTAGGIMSPEFLALTEDATVEEAIRACRAGEDLEMVFYVYVVNEFGHLVGVVSLRQLVTAGPQTRLRDIMETNVVRVRAGVDSGEVAGLVARYNFLAIPVVDDSNKLIGIVTVDDVIDVIREEATEDVLRMVGAGDDIANSRRVGTNLRARLPWVAVAFLGGLVTVPILLAFGPEHLAPSDFLLFAPLLLSLSGNLGIQSSALVERELASGATPAGIVGRVFAREAAVGALFGLVCGGLAAGIAYLVQGGPFAIAVGGSVAVGLVAATATGTLVGVVAALLGQSTGYTVGPLVKALCDAVVLLVYLLISRSLLHLLLPEA